MNYSLLMYVTATLLVACAGPAKVDSEVQMPAKVPEASRLRHIAVVRFERIGPTDITPQVEAELSAARLRGGPYFTLIERSRLDEALKELRLAEAGIVNAATASRIGQMVAAKGIYMGSVTRDDVSNQPYQEQRSECLLYEQLRDKKGNSYQGACLRSNDWKVNCVQRSATFEFVPKLVDVGAGTIVYSKSLGGSAQDRGCSDRTSPLQSPDDLRRQAIAQALTKFREDVAPFTRTVQVVFMETTEGISSAAAKERFEGSMTFARENRLDRACEIWKELSVTERTVPSLSYNLGACAEVSGDLDAALARYSEADRQLTKPDKTISEGLARVRQRQAAERTLR
jgi:hypothetical protein